MNEGLMQLGAAGVCLGNRAVSQGLVRPNPASTPDETGAAPNYRRTNRSRLMKGEDKYDSKLRKSSVCDTPNPRYA